MMNFVLGFFREYWPVVITCALARYGAPVVADWLVRYIDKRVLQDEAERRSGVE
ncbi:hypothetical protein [Burkholderia sp. THE68]|uniref:hypothetical protein n=1 Tax=Burkholderia sp. THE68 TaxID=758782 RepID=UPI00138A2E88|nr:hypothetical protein [Burkholderia sp. THE68]